MMRKGEKVELVRQECDGLLYLWKRVHERT